MPLFSHAFNVGFSCGAGTPCRANSFLFVERQRPMPSMPPRMIAGHDLAWRRERQARIHTFNL